MSGHFDEGFGGNSFQNAKNINFGESDYHLTLKSLTK